MKDKNKVEIKVGDYVKRCGYVQYADGKKYKVSKNTWVISKVDGDNIYYSVTFKDYKGDDVTEDVLLKKPKDDGDFLVIGNEKDGLNKENSPINKTIVIEEGSVAGVYKILKDVSDKNWKAGEVVKIHGKVSFDTLKNGYLEKIGDNVKHQHILVVVDPIKVGLKVKNK